MEPSAASLRFLPMRRSTAAIAVLLLVQGLVQPSLAQAVNGTAIDTSGRAGPARARTGTVVFIDSATMNLVCRDRRGTQSYWVTRATRFRAGARNTSFFNLKTGQPIDVVFHSSGRIDVADVITLLP